MGHSCQQWMYVAALFLGTSEFSRPLCCCGWSFIGKGTGARYPQIYAGGRYRSMTWVTDYGDDRRVDRDSTRNCRNRSLIYVASHLDKQ
jgi:hypothetical protein